MKNRLAAPLRVLVALVVFPAADAVLHLALAILYIHGREPIAAAVYALLAAHHYLGHPGVGRPG